MSIGPAEIMTSLSWPKAILFDLDGTLVDSASDIAISVNKLLAHYDLSALTLAQVHSMIGHGIRKLVERAFEVYGITLSETELDERYDRMIVIYGQHLTGNTVLLDGAADIIAAYHQAGVRLAVVTNKNESFSRTILDHFGLSDQVAVVVGGDTGPTRKPAPDMLLQALKLMKVTAADALMVGDGPADIDAAKAAGIASIAVRGGYTNVAVEELGADFVIQELDELPSAIAAIANMNSR